MALKVPYKRLHRHWARSEGGIYFAEELGVLHRLSGARDCCGVLGILAVVQYPVDEQGQLIPEKAEVLDVGENLVVNLGKEALRELQALTAEGNGSDGVKDLGRLALGRGSSGGASTPSLTTTGLFTESTVPSGGAPDTPNRPTLTVTAPAPGPPFTTNLWAGQIASSEMNNAPQSTINEAGLFCLDNSTLFAMRTFANQTKAVGFVFELRWSTLFT
jgi:hypothetical protein